ncbi:MAG: hypothetical protein OFPI_01940 [Osedax symbiont Rs2]|nr:MAG: hypothetical protein OFPI_01940 [Osedax symbiont Rs2]
MHKKMSYFRLLISSFLLIASVQLSAANPLQQLEKLMAGFSSYSAQFEQYTTDESGRKGEVSKGDMQVQRPNKFRWSTLSPFPQLIVSDGDYIWIYDPDLEQATRKKLQPGEANGATLILNGDVGALTKKFTISQLVDKGREKLFELVPKQEGNFEKIQLFFSDELMRELMLVDVYGSQTTIILSDTKLNPKLRSDIFEFTAPKGTDIMIDGADN